MISVEFLRQFRIGEYAIFDLVVSFLGMYLFAPLLSKIVLRLGIFVPKRSWLFLTLPISILVHLLFGQMTLMTKHVIDLHGHYLLKLVILGLTVFGIKEMSIVKKTKLARET